MTALTDLTVHQALEALAQGQVSSLDLTRACLAQIERLEPVLHAFITLTPERALAQAEAADARRAAARHHPDEPLPPLLGLPIAVKDILALEGVRCTCGSRILETFVPPYTATAVQRLLDAGVVVVGKTNTDEFAMGSSTENSAYGPTRNPWDTERVPGGSSGGSAAAVAARMVPAALGTDTGGSVRQPASFCGVSGIKPTYGRVSRYGLVAYGSSLDTAGAFARNVADVALLFHLMAGHDPLDSTTLDVPVPPIELPAEPDLRGLRVGVPREYFIGGLQPEVEQAVRQAIAVLEALGASVHEVSLPHTEYALPVYYLIAPAEASANLARYDGVRYGLRVESDALWEMFRRTRGQGFGAEVKRRIMLGTYALSAGYYEAYYGQAQKVRTLIKRDFEVAFEQVDVIAAPVAPTTAFRLGEHTEDPLAMYLEDVFTLPTNLAGVPGLAFPVGLDGRGLPIGMQLMGPHFREEVLFRVAHAYQQVTDWHLRKPPLL
ncbi:glutamyl-tRNA amidotransferase [Thermanaerothrix daxensis]|uniref:Glutamyl-tRNA(Gln) amidotransferase subunit A n=1 Tax=Thermanaerothrix daxensis TaxID=869279 RepID=A0A0N8GPX1_9CHLR|nr:Asp-tRNA(Asn)/Glu-tRNA(Gln) amidotransferase subunit GatA [Thermanaerothrix daxensis]KPL82082.1 glutamyl-tRNA amidotransferase [Thermanaerothrix daxensis]